MKKIVVVNPISGHGHLDSWNAIFIRILASRGWYVHALSSNSEVLKTNLGDEFLNNYKNIQFHSIEERNQKKNESTSTIKIYIKNFLRYTNSFGHLNAYPILDGQYNASLKKTFWHYFSVASYCATHFFRFYVWKRMKFMNSTLPGRRMQHGYLLSDIDKALVNFGIFPELVFHMYLDCYDCTDDILQSYPYEPAYSWGGILFDQGKAFHLLNLGIKNMMGLCLLDERMINFLSSNYPFKKFAALPDVTEIKINELESDIAKYIKSKAKGRKIIFLGGMIGAQKNIRNWYRLIRIADPKKWYFIQIGEIQTSSMEVIEFVEMYRALLSSPENLLIYPKYLDSESQFNEIISLSDIIFAAYRKFNKSSNMLAKSAAFNKPILVSKNSLMGQRVEKYGIGLAVDENDPLEMLKAINEMCCSKGFSENFKAYLHEVSLRNLEDCLAKFIEIESM